MKKIIIVAILLSNISYGASTIRQIPLSSKCWNIKEETPIHYAGFEYCEMTNGDVCYVARQGISCFKN